MSAPILATKLYIPPPRPKIVPRPRLVERLEDGFASGRKLAIISAPAGFGKTTLVSEWVDRFRSAPGDAQSEAAAGSQSADRSPATAGRQVAWLSLDAGDHDPARFVSYLVAALQTIRPEMGAGLVEALQSPQPPAIESILTALLNEIAVFPDRLVLVLDDYHAVDSRPVDQALAFLLEHLPPQMHLVIATREDPSLPLARLRSQGRLTELRLADLRFTPAEAADFLTRRMGLDLSAEDVASLEARTEGWIAGLQLAAISMQAHPDAAGFIQSFTGSHHFVLDYLVEEVLQRQTGEVQTFLLRTAILERLCGPLCEAVLGLPAGSGQATLSALERLNLFIVPLDNERIWYRYHHLFGELLRKRLGQSLGPAEMSGLHIRASQWYEDNGLAFEAFRHAAAANDVDRAERLIGSPEIGLHFRSVVMAVLDWLASLPKNVLDARPRLWVRSATLALMAGQTTGVEDRLQAAENALQGVEPDEKIRDLIGQMACARATLALTHYDPAEMILQARHALEYLHPDNLGFLFTANWALASAYLFQGDRLAARRACQECVAISQKSGAIFSTILAISNLAEIQKLDNQLHLAAGSYRQVLQLSGDHPQPNAEEAHLGLACIYYEWNDLDTAEQHGRQSLELARMYDRGIDRFIISEVFLARLKLARGDVDGAAAMLAQTQQTAHQQKFTLRLPEIAAAQVSTLIRQGNLPAAAQLAQQFEIPLSQAGVLLAQGDAPAALAVLEPFRRQMEARGWADELLRTMVLQALAHRLCGETEPAAQVLGEALALAEPDGFIRLFVDEGEPMRFLISDFRSRLEIPAQAGDPTILSYTAKLLAAFPPPVSGAPSESQSPKSDHDLLSPRELEVLRLIAQGLSNQEIGARLFLALDTVKGHNRRIFDKLQVQRRTEAIARAHELGLI